MDRPNTGIWSAAVGEASPRRSASDLTTSVSDFDPANTDARVFAWDIAAGGSRVRGGRCRSDHCRDVGGGGVDFRRRRAVDPVRQRDRVHPQHAARQLRRTSAMDRDGHRRGEQRHPDRRGPNRCSRRSGPRCVGVGRRDHLAQGGGGGLPGPQYRTSTPSPKRQPDRGRRTGNLRRRRRGDMGRHSASRCPPDGNLA